MKALIVILGLICAALAYGLYQRGANVDAEAAATFKLLEAQTNQIRQVETKLALEQGTSSQSISNLQYHLSKRDASLNYTSNRLVQANLLVSTAQSETRTIQPELASKAAQIAVLEGEREALARRLTVIPSLEKQLADLKIRFDGVSTDHDFLDSEVRRLEVEKADLERKLTDTSFLRTQLAKAEEDAELRRRLVKAGTSASVSSKARLELQADGTVRPFLPVATQAKN
jgi:chromosome segregation ATPase